MEKILLIVDDSKEIIDIVQEILGGLFDKIMVAGNVDGAVALLDREIFSFIILDINLDGRNGAEVIKHLNERPENENNLCPVMILSGIINAQFIEKFTDRFASIVTKPFEHDTFLSTVKDILEKKAVEDTKEEAIQELTDADLDELLSDPDLEDGSGEITEVPCELPFPVPQLEQKVSKIIEQVKKTTKLKQLFASLKIDRNTDNYVGTHIGMLINVSTAICTQLEWNTDKTLEKFVYASYLHDMAISTRPDLARFKGGMVELEILKEKLSPQDYKLVHDHSLIAARKIDELEEIPADVGMIVRQHHELPKENGFPARLSHNKITPLATVFIISHDLTHYILEHPKWNMGDYIVKARAKYKGAHFAKILSALSEIA